MSQGTVTQEGSQNLGFIHHHNRWGGVKGHSWENKRLLGLGTEGSLMEKQMTLWKDKWVLRKIPGRYGSFVAASVWGDASSSLRRENYSGSKEGFSDN